MTKERRAEISRKSYEKAKRNPQAVEKRRERWREWYHRQDKSKFEARKRDHNYLARYGISLADYDRMFAEQGGCCRICSGDKLPTKHKHFAVDHCHVTGQVRGLLCWTCNISLGWYERNSDAMHAYLAPRPLRLINGEKS